MTRLLHSSPTLLRTAFWAAMSWSALAAPLGAAASPAASPENAAHLQQRHVHRYVRSTKKVWVPPQYKWVVVGKDTKGKPIRKKQLVRPGYYKKVAVQRCSCGREKN